MDFIYPKVDLSPYSIGFIGKCVVSHIINEDVTYIVDSDRALFDHDLYEERGAKLNEFPPLNEIFAIDQQEDGLYRAVRAIDGSKHRIFLFDVGEIIEVETPEKLSIYSISPIAQRAAARAIKCQIVEILDELGERLNVGDHLNEFLYDYGRFSIKDIKGETLIISLQKINPNEQMVNEVPPTYPTENGFKFTQEQIDILYEEPETTTNASKAILGYVPRDEKRICQFYDPKTGRCFKGNACRLEHVAPLKDGWTRDQRPDAYKLTASLMPKVGSTIKVFVTSIKNLDELFIYIPENAMEANTSLKALRDKLNKEEYREIYQQMKRVPGAHELVLVNYRSEFYRGRIFEVNEKGIFVNLIDSGADVIVALKDLYEWHGFCDNIPALAYRCYLSNVQLRDLSKEDEQKAKNEFRNFVKTDIRANIVGCTDELYVNLIDSKGFDLGEMLCGMGYVENKSKVIPVADFLLG